jgi:hypothetical protein
MENRFSLPVAVSGKVSTPKGSTPWMAFYLASSLGLMLGALSLGHAEPAPANSQSSDKMTIEELRSENTDVSATSANEPGQVNIPGIQSAVLTVGKEIQTNVQMINLDQAQATRNKKSANAATTTSPSKPKYYLELPAPQKATATQDAIPATAASIPVAAVSPEINNTNSDFNTPEINASNSPDPEAQPLDLAEGGLPASGTATNMMIRVTLGLMVVLGMLLAFSKKVLPRLMARHPEFFEKLKQQQGTQAPLDIPQTMAEKLASKKAPRKLSLFGKGKAQKKAEIASQQPAQLELNGKQFNVLSSTAIGKDKDLHLVEIMGRQLVVATTPYTVSLIQDLTGVEDQSPASQTSRNQDVFEIPVTQLNLLENPNHLPESPAIQAEITDMIEAHEPGLVETLPKEAQPIVFEEDWDEPKEIEPTFMEALDTLIPQPDRIIIAADLDDQPPEIQEPEFIRAKSNPYASIPVMTELQPLELPEPLFGNDSTHQNEPIMVSTLTDETGTLEETPISETEQAEAIDLVSHAADTEEEVYLKYLNKQNQTATIQDAYAALESTIVLNDYDDVYGY